MAAEQFGIDALLKEAHALTDANQRSNALLRAFDGIWKRNRQLLGANLDAIMGFQVGGRFAIEFWGTRPILLPFPCHSERSIAQCAQACGENYRPSGP
jgi:hypothetical protein